MHKKTKVLSIVFALCLSISLIFSGCKTSTTPTGTTSSNGTTSSKVESTTPELPQVEITWMYPAWAPLSDQGLIDEAVNKYLTEKIHATIKLQPIDFGSFPNKRDLLISSGEKLDICFTAAWNGYWTAVAKGQYLDITQLIDKYAPKTKAQMLPALLNAPVYKGKNYAIPANKEAALAFGYLVRKDMVDKYKFDLTTIKTDADMEKLFDTIKKGEPGMTPLLLSGSGVPEYGIRPELIGGRNGGYVSGSKEFKVVNEYELPEVVNMLKLTRKWFEMGFINKDAATIADDGSALIKAGKVFSYYKSIKPGQDKEDSLAYGYDFIQIQMVPAIVQTESCTNSMQALSITSKNPERAMMFLELLNTDAYLNNLINFGIENKHYVKKSDTVIDFAPGLDAKKSGYYPNTAWAFANQFINFTWATEDPKKWANYKTWNESAKVSNILGFVYDPEIIKAEEAAVANVNKQYDQALLTGAVDVDSSIIKYTKALKDAGFDKIIAEKQKQLDAWIAAKK